MLSTLKNRVRKILALTLLDVLRWSYWKWNILFFGLGLIIFPVAQGFHGMFGREITYGLSVYRSNYLQWIIIGLVVQYVIFGLGRGLANVLGGGGFFMGPRGGYSISSSSGDLASVLFTPVDKLTLFIGRTLWGQILSFSFLGAYIWIGGAWFSLTLNVNIPLSLLVFFFGIMGQLGLGLISQGMTLRFRQFDPTQWIINMLTQIFSGIIFPIELLPEAARIVSYIFPQTYVYHLARLALLRGADADIFKPTPDILNPGHGSLNFHHSIVALIIGGLSLLYLGALSFKSGFKIAKKEGYLAQTL